jgi:hypothetical protein
MIQLDPLMIHLLRRMAREQSFLADMVREILHRSASSGFHPIEVLNSFRKAFGLTLAQAKPITDWLAYGGGEKADADLHTLVWPCIEANRDFWEREGLP